MHGIVIFLRNSLIMIVLLLPAYSMSVAPTGADLLEACQFAGKNGYDSTQGMMCIWYVTPCDCHFGKSKEIPRVCLPETVSHQQLADVVVRGIQQTPDLKQVSAEQAAANILSPLYPCEAD